MTDLSNRISLRTLTTGDFTVPSLAFLGFFVYQYLFPQYFFEGLKQLEIPTITVTLCIIFALLSLKSPQIKLIKNEILVFSFLGLLFFVARFLVPAPELANYYFNEHLHQTAVGIVLVRWFYKPNKLHLLIVLLIVFSAFSALISIKEGGLIWGHDFLQDENQLSALMSMTIPLTLFYAFWLEGKMAKIFCYVAIAIQLAAVVRSFSRGGFLALIAVSIATLVFTKRKLLIAGLLVLSLLGVLWFAPPQFFSEVRSIGQGTEEATAGARLEYWRRAWVMFTEDPIFGKGIGQFPVLSQKYIASGRTLNEGDYLVCHSNWFQILAELGILGIMCYFVIFAGYFKTWVFARKVKSLENAGTMSPRELNFYEQVATGLGLGMIGFMTAGAFLNILIFPFFYSFMFLMFALRVSYTLEAQIPLVGSPNKYHGI